MMISLKKFLAFTALTSTTLGFAIEPKDTNLGIVGGSDAVDGQFPYQVSIRRNETQRHHCGGSILNSRWILTAAHCLRGSQVSDWFVYAGNVSLSGNGTRRQLSRMILHPHFNANGHYNNDIAVVELQEELKFSSTIQAIELEIEDVGVVDCVVSGWGFLATGGPIPDILQYLNLRTLTSAQCQGFYGSRFSPVEQICTLTRSGEGVCRGDSGGPLVANGRQIGVVSWTGSLFCANGVPDVYIKVSAFIDWIKNSID